MMRSVVPRFSKLLLLAAAFSLLSAHSWGQIRVFPDKTVSGQVARLTVAGTRVKNSDVTWTVELLDTVEPDVGSSARAPAPSPEQSLAEKTPKVRHTFSEEGRYLITATVVPEANKEKQYTTEVVVYPSDSDENAIPEKAEANEDAETESEKPIEDVLVKEANEASAKSELGLTELVVEAMLSDKTLVDELDQRFLESCSAVAKVYREKADEFGDITYADYLADDPPGTEDKVNGIMDDTANDIQDALDELHPNWQRYFDIYNKETRASEAWFAYQDRLVNALSDLKKKPPEYKEKFKYKDAWNELARGFELSRQTKEDFITKYSRVVNDYNMKNQGTTGTGTYTGRKCPLLIRLGLY